MRGCHVSRAHFAFFTLWILSQESLNRYLILAKFAAPAPGIEKNYINGINQICRAMNTQDFFAISFQTWGAFSSPFKR
jgi:hypothetical protein